MAIWKAILRALGLSNEARVRISAPGIEIVLTGDPDKVRALLSVVRGELEKSPRMLQRERKRGRGGRRSTHAVRARDSQVVRPTELDEMDSPYALPEAVVMPVPDEDVTAERLQRPRSSVTPVNRGTREPDTLEPDTVLPVSLHGPPSEETVSGMQTESAIPIAPTVDDGPESEATAISPNPSGGMQAVDRKRRSFVSEGPATLMPSDSENELQPSRPGSSDTKG